MTSSVVVASVGMVPFAKPGASATYDEMGATASRMALADAGIGYESVQQAYAGYVYGDSTAGQKAIYPLGLTGIPIVNVNNNCSTGSTALFLGRQAVASGAPDCVLVLGFEQMRPGPAKPSLPSEEFDMQNLKNKVALVSGSGRAIALKLARHGAKVVVNDADEEPGRAVAEEINSAGGEAVAVNGSVTDQGFPDRFVGAAMETFGGLDVIVNNAGYTWDSTIQKMTDEQFQAMLDVHLVAPFRILRAAAEPIRVMAKREAEAGQEVFRKIVNISSIAGLYGNAGQASYSAAKAALIGLTRTLCKEWGRYKVNVNCVAFGLISTRLTQPIEATQATIDIDGRSIKVGVQPHLLSTFEKLIPVRRSGTPEEAADAVYLFCSPESNYISGQVIVCGGGLLM